MGNIGCHSPTSVAILLCIIIKSDSEPCYSVFTCCTNNFLEYSVVKVLYTNNSVLTKLTQVGNHFSDLGREMIF
jgi:hypothetical protein